MSQLAQTNKPELLEMAIAQGLDIPEDATKDQIIDALEAEKPPEVEQPKVPKIPTYRLMKNKKTGVLFPFRKETFETQAFMVECDAKGKELDDQPPTLPPAEMRKDSAFAGDGRKLEE